MRVKKIKSEISINQQFGQLAEALQEISVLKMADIREMVLKAREYEEGLIDIFADIRLSSTNNAKKTPAEAKMLQAKKNKRVIIMLSANNRLFGHITDAVYDKCIEEVKDSNDELIIVGKIGKQKFEKEDFTREFTYYQLPDYDISFMDIMPMLSHIVEYQSIRVYYAMSTNILTQQAVATNITGEDSIKEKQASGKRETYLVEPTVDALYSFFTGQILGIFFKQTIYEYELARHASRIKTLEESINHSLDNQKKQRGQLHQVVKSEKERKQQMQNMYLYARKKYG